MNRRIIFLGGLTLLLLISAVYLVFQVRANFDSLADQQKVTSPFSWWRGDVSSVKLNSEVESPEVTLFAVGDIMLSRHVESKMLEKQDFSYCFTPTASVSRGADLAIANLESPIITGPIVPTGSFSFRADPRSATSLAEAGFDIVSLANNHFGNQGEAGMLKTFSYLRDVGIDYIGAGASAEKILPVIREVNGLKIAFLGYGYGPNEYEATPKSPGLALMNIEKLQSDIHALEPQVDLIVVVMHDGIEYVVDPAIHQKEFAHAAIEAGADLVIGHHPHVVQKMEIYNGKYIFYSLGNYIFDQMWSLETRQGLGIMFHLDKSGVISLEYYPVRIDDYCQPNWAVGAEREAIISRLQ